jgi:two-component system, NtrC family, nitrogen regulation sensor histidine kinase NtrY
MKKEKSEEKKINREISISVLLAILFCILAWFEIKIFSFGEQLPLNQSIFFFGLINFNLILLLLLSFFILRNLFKAFVDNRYGFIGNSLKSRLIATFLVFSIVPTTLMFVISLFYINASFDRWFSDKMQGVLKSALVIQNEYYSTAKKKNFNAAFVLGKRLEPLKSDVEKNKAIADFRSEQSLDVIEYYPNLQSERFISIVEDSTVPIIPPPNMDILKRVLKDKLEKSEVETLNQGNLIRVFVPLENGKGIIAVSSFVPISVISKMNDVSIAYEEMRGVNTLEYPLKSIYLIVLILMTLMILFCSVWFGVYISRHLSFSLETLGKATQKIAEGKYQKVNIVSGETEVMKLAEHFNTMVAALTKSRRETVEANDNLKITLKELDQRRRYMHVVLSNVNTGVISLDSFDKITMINEKAAMLLQIKTDQFINKNAQEIMDEKYYRLYRQMVSRMKTHKLNTIEKEIILDRGDSSVPSMLKISTLYNDLGEDIGKVVAFDDLTDIVQGQRAAAWKEVARRIAHEVKNPLTPIKLSAQRLSKKFGSQISDPAFSTCINMIIEQTDSLKYLINEFSQFARLPETKTCLGDINVMVEKVISFYEQAHRKIRFLGSLDNHITPFYFDPEQIKRAIFNLVENSVNATSEADIPEIRIETLLDSDNSLVILSVIDNGKNVSQEDMRRMFEPYFSKRPGGSGLGLTIVKKIIEDHNGYVRLLKNNPRGLIAQIELPYKKE